MLLSKTIGKPVRVQWSRQDEHGWDPKGPQQLLDLRAGVDADGRIVAWDTQMWIPTNRRGARILLAAQSAGIPQDSGRDAAAVFENGDPPYAADYVRVLAHWMRDTPLNPSNLRAPGKPANVFAVEGLTDEIAATLRVDALEFRVSRLTDPRALEVLTRASKAFGWQPRPSPNSAALANGLLVGRGVAYTRYKNAENYVALFMDVAVEPATGRIIVRRVVCAHDCGLVVNPNALRNQIEGGIVQTLSRALHEEVQFDESRVTSVDWATYPILRFPEAPAVEVILVERRDEPLWGAGEASTVAVAAALANAVFDATGVRLRRVPFTAARVKAALAAAELIFLAAIPPRFLVVAVDQERSLGLRRRQDRQESHRLLRRVEDGMDDLLGDERAVAGPQLLLLSIHPLLGDAVDDVDDFFARRMVVEIVAGAWTHRDAHQRQQLCAGQRRFRQPPVLAPGGELHAGGLCRDEAQRLFGPRLHRAPLFADNRMFLKVLICSAIARSAGRRSTELAP